MGIMRHERQPTARQGQNTIALVRAVEESLMWHDIFLVKFCITGNKNTWKLTNTEYLARKSEDNWTFISHF